MFFNFFKKSKDKNIEKNNNIYDVESVKKEIDTLLKEEENYLKYEKIGLLYEKINDEDNAILNLEKSLTFKKNIGDGYKCLMKLYNNKRKYYAKNYDNDKLQYYLNKIDEMLQISKDVIRKGEK